MRTNDLKVRTRDYALSVIKLFAELPKRTEAQIIGRQLLRSGTSAGAQYREATRAKSNADFRSKIEGSLQELEESGVDVPTIMDEVASIKGEDRRAVEAFLSAVETLSKLNKDPEFYKLAVNAVKEELGSTT